MKRISTVTGTDGPATAAAGVSYGDLRVPAGFPSPAQDYLEERIDLNQALIRNPAATFLARIAGESMRDLGMYDGDLIVVDRSLTPRPGDVVLAWVQGGFTVKGFQVRNRRAFLVPAHPEYPELELLEDAGDGIWGVVTHVIRSFRGTPGA
ncbi:MAG: translesion error-prone DNA polymerase V autoproteolytic subunit [Verrucomicrobia bacterium]|nr:translesion error-prone DNA polymerase V autoproteolytic subunit [Verrucomicrobiota bacterium]MCH8527337.1 translesion error-prone DNA polymerase V autoproteolytic subunit [Kiritimatiellia bacterium]